MASWARRLEPPRAHLILRNAANRMPELGCRWEPRARRDCYCGIPAEHSTGLAVGRQPIEETHVRRERYCGTRAERLTLFGIETWPIEHWKCHARHQTAATHSHLAPLADADLVLQTSGSRESEAERDCAFLRPHSPAVSWSAVASHSIGPRSLADSRLDFQRPSKR